MLIAMMTLVVSSSLAMGAGPHAPPDTVPIGAMVALVNTVMEERFPDSHSDRSLAVDSRSFVKAMGGSSFDTFRRALIRPVETLGGQPEACKRSVCWRSSTYMEVIEVDEADAGYAITLAVRVKPEDYRSGAHNVSIVVYKVAPAADGWSVTRGKALMQT